MRGFSYLAQAMMVGAFIDATHGDSTPPPRNDRPLTKDPSETRHLAARYQVQRKARKLAAMRKRGQPLSEDAAGWLELYEANFGKVE